ncbi:exported hypothetical protein [Gammaproteobacteria bacterium]
MRGTRPTLFVLSALLVFFVVARAAPITNLIDTAEAFAVTTAPLPQQTQSVAKPIDDISIGRYVLGSKTPIGHSLTDYNYVYKAEAINQGGNYYRRITATPLPPFPAGLNAINGGLSFDAIGPNGGPDAQVASRDTFSFHQQQSALIDMNALRWQIVGELVPLPATNHGTLTGIVVDTLCRGVANATVSVGTVGTTAKTGLDGRFSTTFGLADIGSGQVLLASTTPAGYAEHQSKVVLGPATEYSTTLVVKSVATRTMATEPNNQGLTVQEPYYGWASIPPASLLNTLGTPVTEPVTAQLTTLPLFDEDRPAFPGNDFLGVNPSDAKATLSLEAVVVAEVKLVGTSGTPYHRLATPATLRLAIPGVLSGHLADGDSIPLWYYDTVTGYWRQEGMGTIRRSPTDERLWAEGQVTHLSWWSFAYPINDYACLRFRPVDAETKAPLRHLTFEIEGINFASGTQGTLRGDEVAFTTKRTHDSANPAQVRLMFYENGSANYLQRDTVNPLLYYKVSMPGLATPISMPSVATKHTDHWEDCQDLGLLNISTFKFTEATVRNAP